MSSARGVQQDPWAQFSSLSPIHPFIVEARAATEAMYPGGIYICSFFPDDGFCAGSAPAVQHFLSALGPWLSAHWARGQSGQDRRSFLRASSSQSFALGDFQGCTWIGSSNFKLVGAPLGSTEWCEDLLGRRIRKARALLAAIGKFPDAQGAFCLLRSCSVWSKVNHSCLTVPYLTPHHDVRSALCHLSGRSLSGRVGSQVCCRGRPGGVCGEFFRLS